jgi:hypothetical protein
VTSGSNRTRPESSMLRNFLTTADFRIMRLPWPIRARSAGAHGRDRT